MAKQFKPETLILFFFRDLNSFSYSHVSLINDAKVRIKNYVAKEKRCLGVVFLRKVHIVEIECHYLLHIHQSFSVRYGLPNISSILAGTFVHWVLSGAFIFFLVHGVLV